MSAYADTSFLVAIYLSDAHTPRAATALRRLTLPLPFTPWTRLELRNAIHLAVFRKEIQLSDQKAALSQVEADVRSGLLSQIVLSWADVYREAERLADHHSATLGNRSLDILHVASALVHGSKEMLTFDKRQAALARAAGLRVGP